MLVIGLLCAAAAPFQPKENKQPSKAPTNYFKVEIRGTLQAGGAGVGDWFDLEMSEQPKAAIVTAGVSTALAFGKNKELAALAKKLEGKAVLIGGDLRRASDRHLAAQPTRFVYYVEVNTLKAAE